MFRLIALPTSTSWRQGGHLIADFIRSGASPLTIWYIAGNDLTHHGLEPICDALMVRQACACTRMQPPFSRDEEPFLPVCVPPLYEQDDKQVHALWLKRNPLKAPAMLPLTRLLRSAHCSCTIH